MGKVYLQQYCVLLNSSRTQGLPQGAHWLPGTGKRFKEVKDSQVIQEIPTSQVGEFPGTGICAVKLKNVCFVAEDAHRSKY